MNSKHLIELNNRKRKLLTEENERYYSDMLLYIRLQFRLSEQASEEILMELLDHLLEGQKEGKTARDIFGDDPKAYADEIIRQLPNEKIRSTVPFITGLILNLIGWFFMIRGAIIGIAKPFTDVNESFYIIPTTIIVSVIAIEIGFMVWYIFHFIKSSLFTEKEEKKWKDNLKVGGMSVVTMGLVVVIAYFLPKFGPILTITWYVSLLAGGAIWLIGRFVEKRA
ncbi:DUF1129 family protein [Fervidibacillus halotolerans]|uniref:DUF1129 domain-containing protein n=1 Tax=Fervidibacillus halotolerans TaxID=2980027 RepID=A0A9E8M0W4_9BACI|nr:DUF1129 family protein [Fervidibacillus halotolerans]WAA12860.1 DUF1129 domain-containing protein [Fervidibacillus halotolerans]